MTLPPLPKPDGSAGHNKEPHPEGGYTFDEVDAWSEALVRAYGEACALAERERCVQRCIDIGQTGQEAAFTADRCVAAIRSAE